MYIQHKKRPEDPHLSYTNQSCPYAVSECVFLPIVSRHPPQFQCPCVGDGVGRLRHDHSGLVHCQLGSLPRVGQTWGFHLGHWWCQGRWPYTLYSLVSVKEPPFQSIIHVLYQPYHLFSLIPWKLKSVRYVFWSVQCLIYFCFGSCLMESRLLK